MQSRCLAAVVAFLLGSMGLPDAAAQPFPERIGGVPMGFPTGDAVRLAVTPDGRHVAFAALDPNLVPGDTNGLYDVFVRDRTTGAIERVSVDSSEAQATGGHSGCSCFGSEVYTVAISDDGRRVAFMSDATNLVPGDGNARRDIFVRDRVAGTTVRVSVDGVGTQSNDHSYDVAISGDGTLVAFNSYATNLVPADTNNTLDLFGYTMATGAVERISLTDADGQMPAAPSPDRGAREPSISFDGRYVAFVTEVDIGVTDCVGQCSEVWVRDRVAGTTTQASQRSGDAGTTAGTTRAPRMSPDGRFVSFSSPANLALPNAGTSDDIFLRDRALGTTELVSIASGGPGTHVGCFSSAVSANGRFVAFACNGIFGADDTLNANDIYVRDRQVGQYVRVSVSQTQQQGTGASILPAISADGRFVAFESQAGNFITGQPGGGGFVTFNPFLGNPPTRALTAGMTDSRNAKLSADGRYAFFETADALIAGDTNNAVDVYRKEIATGTTLRVTVDDAGNELPGGGSDYAISADGEQVVFLTLDTGGFALQGEPPAPRAKALAGDGKAALMRRIQAANTNRIGPPLTDMINVNLSGDGSTAVVVTAANGLTPGDGNGMPDVFTADPDTGVIDGRLSAPSAGDSDGPSLNPVMSFDGSVIAFQTQATNLATSGPADSNGVPDVMVALRDLGERKRASFGPLGQSNGPSTTPVISADGGTVVFVSGAGNLAAGDQNGFNDVFRFDVGTGSVVLVSQPPAGGGANGPSGTPAISGDGSVVAWTSAATNLVPSDTNGRVDVFAVELASGRVRHAAITEGGTLANGTSANPYLSWGGQFLAFDTDSTNITLVEQTPTYDVYLGGGPTPDGLLLRSGFEGFDPNAQ